MVPGRCPFTALVNRPATEADLGGMQPTRYISGSPRNRIPTRSIEDVATLKSELGTIFDGFIWAQGHMIFDDPNEIKEHGRTITMTEGFHRRIDRVESELLIEVPYFVVREGDSQLWTSCAPAVSISAC